MSDAAKVRTSSAGLPTDAPGLVRRYRDALGDALTLLHAFGNEADAKEVCDRYGLVYVEPRPEVRLSQSVPAEQRIFDEHTR